MLVCVMCVWFSEGMTHELIELTRGHGQHDPSYQPPPPVRPPLTLLMPLKLLSALLCMCVYQWGNGNVIGESGADAVCILIYVCVVGVSLFLSEQPVVLIPHEVGDGGIGLARWMKESSFTAWSSSSLKRAPPRHSSEADWAGVRQS